MRTMVSRNQWDNILPFFASEAITMQICHGPSQCQHRLVKVLQVTDLKDWSLKMVVTVGDILLRRLSEDAVSAEHGPLRGIQVPDGCVSR